MSKKKSPGNLFRLRRETLRVLHDVKLAAVKGGVPSLSGQSCTFTPGEVPGTSVGGLSLKGENDPTGGSRS